MTQTLRTIGHRTAFNNEQSPYRIVSLLVEDSDLDDEYEVSDAKDLGVVVKDDGLVDESEFWLSKMMVWLSKLTVLLSKMMVCM